MGAWAKLDAMRAKVAATPMIEFNSNDFKSMHDAVVYATQAGFNPERRVLFGWEVLLSRRRQDSVVHWHLSMRFVAPRAITEADHNVAGKIAHRVGAPTIPVHRSHDPKTPSHWGWIETASSA